MNVQIVEAKLSMMILDGQLTGFIDQKNGLLVVTQPAAHDGTFELAGEALRNLEAVLDALYLKSRTIV